MIRNQDLTHRNLCSYLPIAALLVAAVLCLTVWAQRPLSSPAKTPPQAAIPAAVQPVTTHELTATDLEAFLDGIMPSQLEREDVAGAVIAVVKDGQVIFAKGYGYSDMAKRNPVTADKTLFRPGSISKTFTWTSVMQLVEQGKLDLDRDVNDYLDFKIPPGFGQPITLRNIMTHTSGFEETLKDLFVADAQHMYPLAEYVKNHTPERIFAPGTVPAYSNYATTLAGYIVQRVSGKPFEQYVADNIFAPLDMKHTTFVQPLPEDMKPLMSNGYRVASSKPRPFEFVEAFPAGSVSTTALDMCTFMIAHLQNGKYGNAQILRPETAIQMHSRTFGADDRLNGMALGFYEESSNGHRIIGHGGDTELFHSDMHLILDSNVGFFVSYNSMGKAEVSPRTILFERFLDRYFPYTEPAASKVEDAKADTASVSGLYLTSRRIESTFLKLTSFLGQPKVFGNSDGTISIDFLKDPGGNPVKFEEIGPLLYREVHGHWLLAFRKDVTGRMQFQVEIPVFIFQKAGFWENKYWNYFLLIFGLLVTALTVLLWPVGAIVRKHYARPLELTPGDRKLRLIVRVVCILFIVFLAGWLIALSRAEASLAVVNGLGPLVIIFSLLGVVCVCGTIAVCYNALRSWRAPNRWIWSKLHDLALALACICLVIFSVTWNLMNFNMHY